MSEEITEVLFRKNKKDNSIDCILPYDIATIGGDVTVVDYYGHSSASLEYYRNDTKPASPEEYNQLKEYLENSYKYNFKVITRMQYKKYLKEYHKILKTNL